MNEKNLVYDNVQEAFFREFPDLWERIQHKFGSTFDLDKETPGAYLIFEDVVKQLLFELLESGQNNDLLTRFFRFFEDMANSPDTNVSRDLLGIAIVEPLVRREGRTRHAWQYMGDRMKEVVRAEAREQGKEQELPQA